MPSDVAPEQGGLARAPRGAYPVTVTADARPPPAIRITRPYATEEEFLDRELETLSRTGVTLIGAQPRAEGVVLRFELALSTGQVLIRGEGRVIGHKAGTQPGAGGLSVRFTRLDVRSKALIDKAAALRDQRRPSLRPVFAPPSSSRPPTPPRGSTPPPPRARPSAPPPPPSERTILGRPPDRPALLDRLRARAKGLAPEAVEGILEQGRRAKRKSAPEPGGAE
jgi:hypothetical protein